MSRHAAAADERTTDSAMRAPPIRARRVGAVVASRALRGVPEILGESAAMNALLELIDRLSQSEASVLITGESGTGKELVARQLHARSTRAAGPFVAFNCASLPAGLQESELFGHVRGAFTDAKRSRRGLLLEAHGGTLFLDEIGEMPLAMQPKLLRALQEQAVRPVGANGDVAFDARVLAATNRDLESDVERGRFREDLFYRINVVTLRVPALRSRGRDVLVLAQHFLRAAAVRSRKRVTGIAPSAAGALLEYGWPGNVRELENSIERAVVLTSHQQIVRWDLPERVTRRRSQGARVGDGDVTTLPTLGELERQHIARVLRAVDGNKSRAARILGVDRRTLYRKMARSGAANRGDP